MFLTVVFFPLAQQVTAHVIWDEIPTVQRDLCLCSSTGEPEDMTVDCSPADNGGVHMSTKRMMSFPLHALTHKP